MTDTKFKPGHTKVGGRKAGIRNKVTNEYLSELLKAGKEYLPQVFKDLAEDEPAEFAKLFSELAKRPDLLEQLGLQGQSSTGLRIAWIDNINVVNDGGKTFELLDDDTKTPAGLINATCTDEK
jgi:hypothetical protein